MTKLILSALLVAGCLSAQGLTGAWDGKGFMDDSKYGPVPSEFQMTLVQAGSTVTGTFSKDNMRPIAISSGSVTGSQLTFAVKGGAAVLTAKLTQQGGQLVGSFTMSDGRLFSVALKQR